jgi:putative DNA methylase
VTEFSRLIEHAFPLKQTSLDSVHEKSVRHGHISTLHIWPARRPLAACRAALIATLLPDPGNAVKRKELCERIAGRVVKKLEKKKMPNGQIVERVKEETEGGILRWLEIEPDPKEKKKWSEWKSRSEHYHKDLNWFRQEIRKAYGGRAPKVLDPFAGGGAIPLEAMRLGCEATAVDINPVAWFILKCTLEYPQKLAGQTLPLPDFILHNDDFMAEFFNKAKGYGKTDVKAAMTRLHDQLQKKPKRKSQVNQESFQFQIDDVDRASELCADVAWHVRAWGQWVVSKARRELAQYYPTYADFEPIKKDFVAYEHQPMRLVPLTEDGTADIDALNAEFTPDYLEDKRNPRWIEKPTVAYLWARTVKCKNCRATVPLLKTRWLCKKKSGNRSRILLTVAPSSDRTTVVFGVENNVPSQGGNAAQKREHDKRIGAGTMSKAGVKCPCCSAIMTSGDIRVETRAGRSSHIPFVVAVDGQKSKEFRPLTKLEFTTVASASRDVAAAMSHLPDGDLTEATPAGGGRKAARAFSLHSYGMTQWRDLFTDRQRLALATIAMGTLDAHTTVSQNGYNETWREAITAYLTCGFDRLVDFANVNVQWKIDVPTINHALVRFAIQITWDFAEGNPIGKMAGSYIKCLDRIATGVDTLCMLPAGLPEPIVQRASSTKPLPLADIIVTDPPYYDAIPYSDLMDWFYVWLRRVGLHIGPSFEEAMRERLSPKWDAGTEDGELIDDDTRHNGDCVASKKAYEDGMTKVFRRCADSLTPDGRMVIVFANKQPDAWETLVASLIRSGFVVDGSWPIQTEQPSRTRGISSAALASSVWLVCRKRSDAVRPGWDNKVLEEMRSNIAAKLREFWDAGIRGPDFVWAATGPAMEAYSKHPVVRKANAPGEVMGVGEFLNHVRRMVVDYIVGQVLTGEQGADMSAADRLDEVSAYYLLHRHDFGLDDAPVGACILYATACGLTDADLDKLWDILIHAGGDSSEDDIAESDEGDSEGDDEPSEDAGGGSKVKLKPWNQRRNKNMGHDAPAGKAVPLIDRVHRLMHLWKDGDVQKVDEFLDQHALRRNELFKRVVQSLIELSSDNERSLLESISNHIGAKGAIRDRGPELPFGEDELT